MRILLSLVFVATLAIGLGTGCSSTSSSNDGSGTGGTGTGGSGTGTGGSGGQGGSGAMTCSPACGSGSICVGTGTEGGALFMPDDAGVCPTGRHPSGNICVTDLAYGCMTIPAGCGGTVTCACASSLCPASHACQGPSDGILTCIEAVP
jgi:hypothetical protein